jgi:hypothetical protein
VDSAERRWGRAGLPWWAAVANRKARAGAKGTPGMQEGKALLLCGQLVSSHLNAEGNDSRHV